MKMKWVLVAVILLGLAFCQSGQRMLYLGSESVDVGRGNRLQFEFLHDSATKQEIVCAYQTGMGASLSCYPTGRTW